MANYIPGPDPDFTTWLKTFLPALIARREMLGIPQGDIDALTETGEDWDLAITAHNNAQAAAIAATQHKHQTREKLEGLTRSVVRRVQSHPSLRDSDRAALGITIPSSGRSQTPIPTTHPVAQIDTGQRLRHTIHFSDELTPNSRAKPAGMRGCEIWGKADGGPVTDPSQLDFLALGTTSPQVVEYPASDGGKTATYMLRWVNTRGERGPWSLPIPATVTG